MKIKDIPTYNDPKDFENGDNKYPCNTQFMVYNPLVHKYFLTPKALNQNGIDVERRYISSSQNKVQEFIEKVSKKIYDTIQYKSGWQNFEVQLYRVATANTKFIQDKYAYRKQFESALIEEAKWLIENGDALKYSRVNMEAPNQKTNNPLEEFRDLSDISPEALRTLDYLGLTRWFTISPNIRLDKEKY